MPRRPIELPYRIDYLSILDESGEVDRILEPQLPDELMLSLFRAMLLGRRFDERMLALQRQGRLGTFGPIKGQEAAQVGAVAALRDDDWMVPAFREAAAELWRGRTMESVLIYYAGYDEGGSSPDGVNVLPIAIPVSTQLPHAVGIGMAIKYRKKDQVAMSFCGDGGTSEGDFHEALNFAGVYQTPNVFVVQNNQWAISLPRSRQTRSETLAQKAIAHGMPGMQVDGNDVLAVYVAATEAVDRARSGGGPTLIECVTYRLTMHTTADDPKRYRADSEVEAWTKRDPIPRYQKYLTSKGVLTDEKVAALEEEIKGQIQAAVKRAEHTVATLADPLQMFEHRYAEMPAYVLEQREELRRELSAGAEAANG